MSKSGDISDLPGNLAKMSISVPKVEKNYTLNLKISYTKCLFCSYDIAFSKNALVFFNIVKNYKRSKEGISRKEMKKLAEAGDWKAALVII